MNRKPGLSIERHQEIGMGAGRIQDRLVSLSTEIINAYPVNSRLVRMLTGSPSSKALGGVFRLRCELENCMLAEHRDDARATVHVYFPAKEERWPAGNQAPVEHVP